MHDKILEKGTRLSESKIWALQYDAYCQFGVEAWSKQGVPSYMTSNSFIAKNYAHTVLGFLRDCIAQSQLDSSHPIYILDLGAGTGRFAYQFLQELLRLISSMSWSGLKICYVMTDIAEGNIAFWRKHPYLQGYFDSGVLDCAFYYHAQSDPIQLIVQGKELSKATVVNPMVLICNYYFDTIPQDMFRVDKGGSLQEGRVTVSVNENQVKAKNSEGPDIINSLRSTYSYHPIPDVESYYPEKELNDLLETYRRKFEGCHFLFPIGALRTLRYFIDNVQSRLLLVAGDQGVSSEEQVRQWGEPTLSLHGSFSMAVSYHAIAAFFEQLEGKALTTSFPDPIFVVMAGLLGEEAGMSFPETSLAFREHVDSFEPSDFWKAVSLTEEEWPSPPLEQVLLLVKLGNWDAVCFHAFFPLIREWLPKAAQKQRERVLKTIELVWEHFYPVAASEGDFVMNLGVLLFDIKCYAEALTFFERSTRIFGRNPKALRNMARCNKLLGNQQLAEDLLRESKVSESKAISIPQPFK
jgi:hypothetical protein